ncbi:hypothetical protein PHYPO_G00169240 [Pangasianodon hypophthalmus]|uniref:Uncharacterized protein n=1 Tax=Pangasianodon hypophthalmus TaxID=310915 RepID=A0A5N5JEF9_PANHP|nr:hypothetical protein PHYPO_G00169240 [Pangasianodon hypophthalmus]
MESTDQLEHRTQNKALTQSLEVLQVPPLYIPHSQSDQHSGYLELGHCLRANIFPGPPVRWSSLTKDSYVPPPLSSVPPDPQLWHGRRTDDMGRWTERNIVNQNLQKALKEMGQKNMARCQTHAAQQHRPPSAALK